MLEKERIEELERALSTFIEFTRNLPPHPALYHAARDAEAVLLSPQLIAPINSEATFTAELHSPAGTLLLSCRVEGRAMTIFTGNFDHLRGYLPRHKDAIYQALKDGLTLKLKKKK